MRVPLSIESYRMISRMVFESESAICGYCGKTYPPARSGQRFCSKSCYDYKRRSERANNGASSKK